MWSGADRGIPDLNSVVNTPGGDGRRLLVEDHGIKLTPAKLRRLTDKKNNIHLRILRKNNAH
jgi:hypothetical protein